MNEPTTGETIFIIGVGTVALLLLLGAIPAAARFIRAKWLIWRSGRSHE
jgi:hypothetical protein